VSKGKFQLGVKGVSHFLTEVFFSCSGQYFSIVWLLRSKNMDNLEKVKKSRVFPECVRSAVDELEESGQVFSHNFEGLIVLGSTSGW
jgi:hypothetical protein